jgi:hypothetical protein
LVVVKKLVPCTVSVQACHLTVDGKERAALQGLFDSWHHIMKVGLGDIY